MQGKVDKLRHLVNKNSDIILSAARQISTAASASFPPAAAIMTAFTWIMKGAKDISADYDMVESFFDIMHSFLERIALLEGKLSVIQKYQVFLMRVFCSILAICSITSTYQKDGRFCQSRRKCLVYVANQYVECSKMGLSVVQRNR